MPKDQITPEQLANIPLPPQFEKLVTALHSQYYSQQSDVLKDMEQGYKMIIGGLVLKLQQLEKENNGQNLGKGYSSTVIYIYICFF